MNLPRRLWLLATLLLATTMLVAACSDDSGSEDATSEPTTSGETTETGTPTSTEAGGETSNAMPGEGVSVQPARATWNTGYFQEAIYSAALEDLGYDVAEAQVTAIPAVFRVRLGMVDHEPRPEPRRVDLAADLLRESRQ